MTALTLSNDPRSSAKEHRILAASAALLPSFQSDWTILATSAVSMTSHSPSVARRTVMPCSTCSTCTSGSLTIPRAVANGPSNDRDTWENPHQVNPSVQEGSQMKGKWSKPDKMTTRTLYSYSPTGTYQREKRHCGSGYNEFC